jgi:DNA repair protein RadC
MNYKTSNELLTVCEVKISYQPTVKPCERPFFSSSHSIYKFLIESEVFDPLTIEYKEFFKVMLLNNANKLLGISHLSEGSIDRTSVDIRHIMQSVILSNATGIIVCHNHPSGNLLPSVQDNLVTQKINEACKIFDIFLADHLIISSENYYSYADDGRLWQ